MAKTSADFEKQFIETIHDKTGKTLVQWLSVLGSSKLEKTKEIIDWLKKEQGLNHLQAQLLTGIHLNKGAPVYINETQLLDSHFSKSPDTRIFFNELSKKLIAEFPETQMIAKKTYISFTAVREFAAVNIKPNEIRLGLDLGNQEFTDLIQKSKLTGPMPRISHMLILSDIKQFDKAVKELCYQSYNRTHKK